MFSIIVPDVYFASLLFKWTTHSARVSWRTAVHVGNSSSFLSAITVYDYCWWVYGEDACLLFRHTVYAGYCTSIFVQTCCLCRSQYKRLALDFFLCSLQYSRLPFQPAVRACYNIGNFCESLLLMRFSVEASPSPVRCPFGLQYRCFYESLLFMPVAVEVSTLSVRCLCGTQ